MRKLSVILFLLCGAVLFATCSKDDGKEAETLTVDKLAGLLVIGEGGDNTKLYFSTKNTLYWPNGAMTINPFRAYLQLNSTAAQTRSIVLNIGDEMTEIEVRGVKEVREINDDAWYDMSGRKLDGKPNTKGVFIHNGRKMVVK